jgi:uncharacterized membrane protein
MSATQTEWTPPPQVDGLTLVIPPRSLPAGEGWTWIASGWRLFTRAPLMWILSLLIVLVAAVVMNFVPILGGIAFQVLNAVIAAGFTVACRSLEQGGEFELEHLFAGFKIRFGSLVIVGLLFLAGSIAIFLVFAAFLGFTILGAVLTGDSQAIVATVMKSFFGLALGGLVALALWVPLIAAFWFAPALVVMHDVRPLEAMKQSFIGSFRNFMPFLVYSIVMLVFAVIAAIPFGLGYLAWVPLAIASTYAAYRAIFTADAAPATAPATLA